MDTPDISPQAAYAIALVFWGLIAAGVVALLAYLGVFAGRGLDKAPPRRGSIGLMDLLVGAGLWLLGPTVLGTWVAQSINEAFATQPQRWMLQYIADHTPLAHLLVIVQMAASQLGAVPAILYVLWRAAGSMEAGLAGFGLSLRAPLRPLGVTAAVAISTIVLTMAASAVIASIISLSGYEPPTVAHDLLKVLVDADSPLIRWPILIGAVVIAPIVEEPIFRGLFQTVLIRYEPLRRRRWAAIAIAATVFAVVHVGVAELIALPMLLVLGMGLGYAYERTGRLWSPMLIHAAFNALSVAITSIQDDLEALRQSSGL